MCVLLDMWQPVWCSVLTLLSFVLVCVSFARAPHRFAVVTQAYVLVPRDAGCAAWIGNECVEFAANGSSSSFAELLSDVLPLAEHRATGLFSETNALVVSLCAEVLVLVFFLVGYGSPPLKRLPDEDDDAEELQTRWFFRKAGFALLFGFALLLFFMQGHWQLPQNNLLWLETLLFASFFALGQRHHYYYHEHNPPPKRLKNRRRGAEEEDGLVLAMPMLAVAALAAAGETDALALWLVYCSLTALLAFDADVDDDDVWWVGLNYVWLCVVPFVVYASLRLDALSSTLLPATPAPAAWAVAAVGVCLAWALLHAVWWTTARLLLPELDAGSVAATMQLVVLAAVALLLQIGGLLELVQANQ